jgi:hypothetical protein
MLTSDLLLALLAADLRTREACRTAQADRLLRLAQHGQAGGASRQARRLLHWTAHVLVGMSQKLHEYASRRPFQRAEVHGR